MDARTLAAPIWSRSIAWRWHAVGWATIAAAAIITHWAGYYSEDVSWLMVAAERVIDGGRWGTDILENNTPAAALLYAPAVLLARVTGLQPMHGCDLWIVGILLFCSAVTARVFALICGRAAAGPQAMAAGLLTFAVLGFGAGNFGFPAFGLGNNFGQRDHVIAALLLPFILLVQWMDFQPERSRTLHRIAILMAGAALCIKPQYIVPMAIIGALVVYRHGWEQTVGRIGLAWFLAIGTGYVAALLVVFPEWFPTARLTLETYGAYRTTWGALGFSMIPALLLLTVTLRLLWRPGDLRPVLQASAVAGAGYLLLSVTEDKPWFYQQLPAILTLLAGLGLAIAARLPRVVAARHGFVVACILLAVLPVTLMLTTWRNQSALLSAYERQPLIQELHRSLAPGDSWAVISASVLPAFPTTSIEGYHWVLRGPSLWPLPGAVQMAVRGPEARRGADIVAGLADGVAQDLLRGRPRIVVLDGRSGGLLQGTEILDFLLDAPSFAAVWSGYELHDRVGDYEVYVPLPPR